jgi:hypothetical protein
VPSRGSAARVELSAATTAPAWTAEVAAVRAEVSELRDRLEALAVEVRDLKSALGA